MKDGELVDQTQERPRLDAALTEKEFSAWYWLKEELVEFCRAHGVSPSGSKREIEARIVDFLAGRRVDKSLQQKARVTGERPRGVMPREFRMEMLIGPGWRCGPALGAYLRGELGNGFRFNAAVREFIHTGKGKRLGDVADCWRGSQGETRAIPEQLEYNRHFRAYFQEHPGATREEAVAAWWALRGKRKES